MLARVQRRSRRKCLRTVNGRGMMVDMETTDRMVVVSARQLDDLLELAGRAADRLAGDPVGSALSGARAEVLRSATVEP